MKTTFLLIFLLLLINGSIMGQIGNFKFSDSELKRDLNISKDPFKNFQIDTGSNAFRNFDLSVTKKFQIPDFNKDIASQDFPKVMRSKKDTDAEGFPGSARFYGYNPNYVPDTTQNDFLKRPDPRNKYYLIIIDPIHHRITR